MSTLIKVSRTTGRAVAKEASIREVSLVGRPPSWWAAGEVVAWAGHSYRIVLDEPGYAHLRPNSEES